VSDDPDVTLARGEGSAEYLLPPRLRPPDVTPDPARLGWQVLQAMVPGFADAAAVFVLEELLGGGNPAGQVTGTELAGLVARRLAAGSAVDGRLAPRDFFPLGEVVAFAADSPCTRCMRDGAPVIFTQPGGPTARGITQGTRTALGGYASFLAAPMITRGTAVGLLVLARAPGAPLFRDADLGAAADLAVRAGAAIAGSLALMRHRSVAEALQQPKTAVSRVTPGRLEIAGRCLPAEGYDVGGDWYDIIPLPGERSGLIVGDVMGHGPQAATVMSRLSAVAYALADLDLPPAEVMRQLNRTAIALPQAALVTCAYAVIDPGAQSCTIATAGHLPPVLALPDGSTRVPDLPGGQSLGVAPASYGEARIKLRPGTTLALYTDGLVETRTRPFDQGILALRSALALQQRSLDTTCEELIASLGERYEDDITLVLARIPPNAPRGAIPAHS
jgi:hypothetical protein